MNKQSKPAIVCKNVHKFFGEGAARIEALRGVNLTINQGELRMLMGPSGSGKTTLISIIAGILTQDEGQCLINGMDLNHLPDAQKTQYRGDHIGFVFQIFNLIPSLTVEENIYIPLLLKNIPREEAHEKARALLKEFNMGDKIGSYPRNLSGGEKQRVAIARGIIHDPDYIVCDEPTSFLDHVNGMKIMELLKKMIEEKGLTAIVVTHDARIKEFADRIDYLEDGRIVNNHINTGTSVSKKV